MSWLNTLSAGQWLLLAAVPAAIVALYFLKLRRQPVLVPSTYLWTRAIEDLHVNSLWQRLRQSLLLFLQLLLVGLAMLAGLRPGWRGTELRGGRSIFLIDASASMSATDVAPSRLAAAKRRAIELINQMQSGDVALVVSFSDVARVEQSFTDDRGLLRQKVNRIQPTSRRSDLQEALRVAAGLANPGRTSQDAGDVQVAEALPATVYILSDGGFPGVPNFSLGNLTPVFLTLGTETPANVGIVAFSAERNPEKPGQIQAFVRLENSGVRELRAALNLSIDGRLADASDVTVPAGGDAGVRFELANLDEGVLKVEWQQSDDLALDNVAHSVLGTPRQARVLLVTPGNEPLEFAATTPKAREVADVTVFSPEQLDTDDYRIAAAAGSYDLTIFDRCRPAAMPQASTIFIGSLPPAEGWSRGDVQPLPFIIDTDRAHPLTDLVEMSSVKYILDGSAVQGPPGATTLFDSSFGPLLVVAQRDGFEDVVLGFEIVGQDDKGSPIAKTDWPARSSFPLFVMNALRYLGGSRGALAVAGVQPGGSLTLRARTPVDRIEIESPSGRRSQAFREGSSTFVVSDTEELGVYQAREGSSPDVSQRFAVNLLDSRESRLKPQREIQLGYETVSGQSGSQPTRRELWKPLMLIALAVLLFEWYVYNRRAYL